MNYHSPRAIRRLVLELECNTMELRHLLKDEINGVMIEPAAKEGEDVVAPIGDAKTEQVGALAADQYPA